MRRQRHADRKSRSEKGSPRFNDESMSVFSNNIKSDYIKRLLKKCGSLLAGRKLTGPPCFSSASSHFMPIGLAVEGNHAVIERSRFYVGSFFPVRIYASHIFDGDK